MSGRKKTVQIKFRVTEEERKLIEEKMKLIIRCLGKDDKDQNLNNIA